MSVLPLAVDELNEKNSFVSDTVTVPPVVAAGASLEEAEGVADDSSEGLLEHAVSTRAPAASMAAPALIRLIFNVPPEKGWTVRRGLPTGSDATSGHVRPP